MLVVCTYFICNKVNEYFLDLKEKLIGHIAHLLKVYGQHRKTNRQKDDGQRMIRNAHMCFQLSSAKDLNLFSHLQYNLQNYIYHELLP